MAVVLGAQARIGVGETGNKDAVGIADMEIVDEPALGEGRLGLALAPQARAACRTSASDDPRSGS
jgi:hypothetical protein